MEPCMWCCCLYFFVWFLVGICFCFFLIKIHALVFYQEEGEKNEGDEDDDDTPFLLLKKPIQNKGKLAPSTHHIHFSPRKSNQIDSIVQFHIISFVNSVWNSLISFNWQHNTIEKVISTNHTQKQIPPFFEMNIEIKKWTPICLSFFFLLEI